MAVLGHLSTSGLLVTKHALDIFIVKTLSSGRLQSFAKVTINHESFKFRSIWLVLLYALSLYMRILRMPCADLMMYMPRGSSPVGVGVGFAPILTAALSENNAFAIAIYFDTITVLPCDV